jgi:cell division protein FtsQ
VSRHNATSKAKQREEKLKKIRRRQRLQMGLMTVLVVIVLAALVWLYRSDLFRVKKIEITGTKRLSKGQIEKIINVGPNDSLIRIPIADIKKRIKKNLWVKNAEIGRSFPNTLKVKITERKAIAIVPVADGNALADKEGLVLEKINDIDKADLVLIRDLDVARAKVGQRIKSKSFSNASLCLSNLDAKLAKSLSIVSAPSVDKLSLYTKKGVEILYGKAENFKKKNYIINQILKKDGEDVIFIDIRVVSNPVVKKRP